MKATYLLSPALAGILTLWGCKPASASPPATAVRPIVLPDHPVQEIPLGDMRVEMGRTVRLELAEDAGDTLRRCAKSIARALAPASNEVTSTTTAMGEVLLHWSDPAGAESVIPMRAGTAELSIPAGPARTAAFYITWRSPGGELDIRVPSSPAPFRAQIIPQQPASILEGTGSSKAVFFGDKVPIRIRVFAPGAVSAVTFHHRSASAAAYSSAPAKRIEGDEYDGAWTVELDRPSGLEASIEYWADIVDAKGRHTSYGASQMPYRIRLLDPTEPQR